MANESKVSIIMKEESGRICFQAGGLTANSLQASVPGWSKALVYGSGGGPAEVCRAALRWKEAAGVMELRGVSEV